MSSEIGNIKAAALLVCALALAACGQSTDIADLAPSATDFITTATTSQDATGQTVAESGSVMSDKAQIASTIAKAKARDGKLTDTLVLSWANDETGNSGTITAIENALTDDGAPCVSFLTTVESYTGMSLYDGKACNRRSGGWMLSLFRPKALG